VVALVKLPIARRYNRPRAVSNDVDISGVAALQPLVTGWDIGDSVRMTHTVMSKRTRPAVIVPANSVKVFFDRKP